MQTAYNLDPIKTPSSPVLSQCRVECAWRKLGKCIKPLAEVDIVLCIRKIGFAVKGLHPDLKSRRYLRKPALWWHKRCHPRSAVFTRL